MLPELYPSLGDINKIGVEYTLDTTDDQYHVIYSYDLALDEGVSIHARITKLGAVSDLNSFGHFETACVFRNEGGTIVRRNQADMVVLRDNVNVNVLFDIVGTTVVLKVKNYANVPAKWSAIVSIINIQN